MKNQHKQQTAQVDLVTKAMPQPEVTINLLREQDAYNVILKKKIGFILNIHYRIEAL